MKQYQVNKDLPIDRILVSILQKRLKSITEEMSIAMTRTTRSPILCEARDFVTGLYDYKGDMLEQKENLPVLAFSASCPCASTSSSTSATTSTTATSSSTTTSFPWATRTTTWPCSSPSSSKASWWPGARSRATRPTSAATSQGGYNPEATEVWQETLRIPPVKVYDAGVLRKDVWDLIFANIRLDIVAEDMRAETGSCVVGERGVHKLLERYGREVFEAHKEFLFDSTEQMMRNEIRSIPEGVYTGESFAYYDGKIPGRKYRIFVTITVKDGSHQLRLQRHRRADRRVS